MNIRITEQDDVYFVRIEGRFTVGTENIFKNDVSPLESKATKIVFDCSSMEYIDSTGLGMVVRFFKDFTAKRGKFALVALQPKPKMVFEITRAYKIFNIFDTVEQAIESFK